MSISIAKRYAQSIFELASEQDQSELIYKDLRDIHQVCDYSEEFRSFIADSGTSVVSQQQMITQILKGKVKPLTLTFLMLLSEKGRLEALPDICSIYECLYLASKNIVQARIESKVPLKKSQIDDICAKFNKILGKRIDPIAKVNPNMLGGFRVQINDSVYDFTIESKLNKFKRSILN